MPEAFETMPAPPDPDNAAGARLALLELEPPTTALHAAAGVLVLVSAGITARRDAHDFAPWEGEALDYLAAHIHDLAETCGAIVEARRPAWRVAEPFRCVLRPGEDAPLPLAE